MLHPYAYDRYPLPTFTLSCRSAWLDLTYASEIRAPQSSSHDLALLEDVQRRTTKFILQDFDLSYSVHLKTLKLLPISYWLELKDILFFFTSIYKVIYDLDVSVLLSLSLQILSFTLVQTNKGD
jgi:hypothetical protein